MGGRMAWNTHEELFRKSLTFTDLKKSKELLHQVEGILNLESHRFDKIDKTVKNGELVVEGVKAIPGRPKAWGVVSPIAPWVRPSTWTSC